MNGDPARVQQALSNLLTTALHFTDEGRVKVRASAEREAVMLDVSDSGLGLSEQQLATIWDPFHVGHATGARAQSGSGLALAVSRAVWWCAWAAASRPCPARKGRRSASASRALQVTRLTV